MRPTKKAPNIATMIIDPAVPLEQRRRLLGHVCLTETPENVEIVGSILNAAASANGEALEAKKAQELAELIQQMQEGPLREAVFISMLAHNGNAPRALVSLQDGTYAYPVVPDAELAASLHRGERVLLEAQARVLLYRHPWDTEVGEEARLERRLGKERLEVVIRDHERYVFLASHQLAEKLDAGEVSPGGTLLVSPRQAIAFDAVPAPDGLSHFRYLCREPAPNVVVARDIGAPPAFIEELVDHVRREMMAAPLGRRYHVGRAVMKLLTGVSGSGKTLCILGFWRRLYELISEVTGMPLDQLPPRVLRLRMSQVLSKWLGDSDKQIDRFFDEAEQLADQTFTAPDGKKYQLPTLVIGEECDGLARARGMGIEDGVMDRIQTTLLQRLDTTYQKLNNRLIVFIFTTNIPHVVDPAFIRRAGGTTEHFGRLNKRQFLAVISKHLHELPFQPPVAPPFRRGDTGGCESPEQAERRVTSDVMGWLFSPNGADRGQVELRFTNAAAPAIKYRRDFLTGALVDRSVQQAASVACRAEFHGCERPGVNSAMVISAFDQQIRSIVDQLSEHNAINYLTLPDGVRVASVRRIEHRSVLPFELERAS